MEPEDGHSLLRWPDKAGNSVKVTYQRSQLDSQSDVVKKEVDPRFANDQYWTLLPFHLMWDGATPTDDGQQKLPIGKGRTSESR